jgi:23S rRNA (adenine2030-N6)-methyltransferase
VRLSVQEPDAQGFGLAGSGVFVLNPPHTLHATLAATLPYLVDVLGRYAGANFLIDRVEG